MTATEIDLTPFCAGPDNRRLGKYPGIVRPFVRAGYRYASDAVVCVRVPAPGVRATPGDFPAVNTLFLRTAADLGASAPWPDTPMLRGKIECEACDGRGKSTADPCPVCGGSGTAVGEACQRVGWAFVRASRVRLIRTLPVVRYYPTTAVGPGHAIAFGFDGGEGLVMPCDYKPEAT